MSIKMNKNGLLLTKITHYAFVAFNVFLVAGALFLGSAYAWNTYQAREPDMRVEAAVTETDFNKSLEYLNSENKT